MNAKLLAPATLAGLAIFVFVSSFTGQQGLVKTYQLFLEKHRLIHSIQKLNSQNQTVKQEIALLKGNDHTLKRRIKEELNMVEEREIMYMFP
jgi:cell division protein FtsB